MEMKFHLDSDIFELVKDGKKDVEVRLNDEKRQKLSLGDILVFLRRPLDDELVNGKVVELKYYDDFNSLVDEFEMKRLYKDNCTKEEYLALMNRFYSLEDVKKYGVVAIIFNKL